MTPRNSPHCQSGLTLVELMVGVSVTGVLAVAASKYFGVLSQHVTIMSNKSDNQLEATRLLSQFNSDFFVQSKPLEGLILDTKDTITVPLKAGGSRQYRNRCNALPPQFLHKDTSLFPDNLPATAGLNVFCPNLCTTDQRPYVEVSETNAFGNTKTKSTWPLGTNVSLFGMKICVKLLNPLPSGGIITQLAPNDKYIVLVLTAWDPGLGKKILWSVQGGYLGRNIYAADPTLL